MQLKGMIWAKYNVIFVVGKNIFDELILEMTIEWHTRSKDQGAERSEWTKQQVQYPVRFV